MSSTDLNCRVEAPVTEGLRQRTTRFSVEEALLVLLVTAAFLFRLWPVWQVHFWDEAVYLQNAEVICCAKTNYSELSSRPPLLSLLFAGIFLIWHSAYAASILTAALNSLGPLFLYLIGRRIGGRLTAAIAALLLAFLPFFVGGSTGNSLLTDSPALSLILICFWTLLKVADAGIWSVFAGFMGALAVLTRFASLPTVALLSLLLLRSDRKLRAVIKFVVGFAVAFGPYLLWSRIRYGGFLTTLRQGWANVTGSVEPALFYCRHFVEVFSWITVAGLALWLVARALNLKKGQVHDGPMSNTSIASISAAWNAFLWAWVAVIFIYFSAIAHKEPRYILPLAPPLLLLAGDGLAQLMRFPNRAARTIGVVVLALALGYTFAPDLSRFRDPLVSPFISEEKDASDYLNSIAPKSAVLYANFNYPVFGYYTRLTTHVLLDQGDAFYARFPQNMPADGYLLLYPELDKDPRVDWVDSNAHFRRMREFPSLVVYEYRVHAQDATPPHDSDKNGSRSHS